MVTVDDVDNEGLVHLPAPLVMPAFSPDPFGVIGLDPMSKPWKF